MSSPPAPAAPIPALIVAEAQPLLRGALAAALAPWPHGPVRTAADATELHGALDAAPTALLLLDPALAPGGLRPLRARHPHARILVLGAGTDPEEARRCLDEGADGHIARTAGFAALTRAIDHVRDGASRGPAARLGAPPPKPLPKALPAAPRPAPLATLTGRQQEVVRLLAEGRSTKDIARALDLAVSTVKVHLAAVYRTFGARNRVEALCRAGCLPPPAAMLPPLPMPPMHAYALTLPALAAR